MAAGVSARQRWMGVLAKAPPARLARLVAALERDLGGAPAFDWLRPPEVGAVMVRGRMGGTGSAFNLGEMSVTRCVLRLADGMVGHAHVQGRDKGHARHAALVDALMQGPQRALAEAAVIAPLAAEATATRAARAAKAAATKVEFFTMVRGED